MSIERIITALELISASLATLAESGSANAKSTALLAADYLDKTTDVGIAKQSGEIPAPEAKAPTPSKRSRPAATEVVKAEGVKVDAPVTKPVPTAEPEAPTPDVMDYDVLKRAVLEVGSYSEQGRAAVIKLLGDYGVKNAKEIQPELREDFHSILLGLLTDLQNAESETDDGSEFA